MPPARLRIVLFPAPLGPSMTQCSPRPTVKEMPGRMTVDPRRNVTSVKSRAGLWGMGLLVVGRASWTSGSCWTARSAGPGLVLRSGDGPKRLEVLWEAVSPRSHARVDGRCSRACAGPRRSALHQVGAGPLRLHRTGRERLV